MLCNVVTLTSSPQSDIIDIAVSAHTLLKTQPRSQRPYGGFQSPAVSGVLLSVRDLSLSAKVSGGGEGRVSSSLVHQLSIYRPVEGEMGLTVQSCE